MLSACGGSDSSSSSNRPNGTDRAFATQMIDHHQLAIDMAKVAEDRADRPEIKTLAAAIITAQEQEIAQLKAVDKRLAAKNIETGDLKLPASMMGMNMDNSMLATADPFDREFIDMMVPHHQGAHSHGARSARQGQGPAAAQARDGHHRRAVQGDRADELLAHGLVRR
ncbi:MAG: DUF305 domain-containing protein [Actinobacteria bacterium]|nr:DUF305 domain-containing protein [Actinomycetota bacterium]